MENDDKLISEENSVGKLSYQTSCVPFELARLIALRALGSLASHTMHYVVRTCEMYTCGSMNTFQF